MATQAELLQRERDRENGVAPKKRSVPKPLATPGANRGRAKDALMNELNILMDELNIKRLKMNQSTDSNQ